MEESETYELGEVLVVEEPKLAVTPRDMSCPLCGRSDKKMERGKPLYGTKVCRKCYYGFANRRQIAYVVDMLLLYMLLMVLFFAIGLLMAILSPANTSADEGVWFILVLLGAGIGSLILFTFKDGFRGYSLGKLIFGVRVIEKQTGEPIGFGKSFRRNIRVEVIGTLLKLIPFAGGIASLVFYFVIGSKLCEGPRMGDDSAGTKVIWNRHKNKHVFVDTTFCEKCGYDLRVTSRDECPECGEGISARKRQVIRELYGEMGAEM
ncbi:RDD family protein [Poriferisphaera sp. WC338]|uniref:RDD family protein n=1 Tax=Poriferisphaera sp. WC338 TaxID=3425129 RepID=UPI003D819FE5